MSTLDKKRLDRLYQLLNREKDPDTAAALRWAIFTLEQYLKRKGPLSTAAKLKDSRPAITTRRGSRPLYTRPPLKSRTEDVK